MSLRDWLPCRLMLVKGIRSSLQCIGAADRLSKGVEQQQVADHCSEHARCGNMMWPHNCCLLLRRAGFDLTIEAEWVFSNGSEESSAQGSLK